MKLCDFATLKLLNQHREVILHGFVVFGKELFLEAHFAYADALRGNAQNVGHVLAVELEAHEYEYACFGFTEGNTAFADAVKESRVNGLEARLEMLPVIVGEYLLFEQFGYLVFGGFGGLRRFGFGFLQAVDDGIFCAKGR